MQLLSPIKISYKNLVAAKFRSFLTMLGVIIGVSAVIVIMSIGLSAQALILDQIKGIGSNLIAVLPGGSSNEEGPPAAAMGVINTDLSYDDLQALRNTKNIPEVEAGAGYVIGTGSVVYENKDFGMSFTGTTASYIEVEDADVISGRFFNEDEETSLAKVVVLGYTAADDLFDSEDPLNKKIEINNHNFLVVGVLAERGSAAFGIASQDDSVFVPVKTAQKLLLGINHLGFARLKVKSKDQIESAKANIKATLRERHNIDDPSNDDFSVRDQESALEIIGNVTDALRYFLLSIGTVALIVGGIGIMNIMLIAVSQRIKEVGLRKAVGAKNIDIIFQFLVESATISFIGGLVGIIIGIAVSFLAAIIIQKIGYNWPFIISFESIIVAVLVSIGIGIIFGMYPARKASKISPMEALRYE